MTRDETLALWGRCEAARETQPEENADTDAAHAAAKAVWDRYFEPLLQEREALKAAGRWKLGKGRLGGFEFLAEASFSAFGTGTDGKPQPTRLDTAARFEGRHSRRSMNCDPNHY